MQDKMERLLNQIGMNKDYLENASIDKIIVYDRNNLWEFIISNDKVLPVYIYDELCNIQEYYINDIETTGLTKGIIEVNGQIVRAAD